MITDFSVNETRGSGAHVVVVAGEVDVSTAPELRSVLAEAIERREPRIVVDLTETTFLDSSGLGVVLAAARGVRAHDGALAVVNVDATIARTFEITGLDQILAIRATRSEAIGALSASADASAPPSR